MAPAAKSSLGFCRLSQGLEKHMLLLVSALGEITAKKMQAVLFQRACTVIHWRWHETAKPQAAAPNTNM